MGHSEDDYSEDSGGDSDYSGGEKSFEDDKYISDSEASEDEKKRKRSAKASTQKSTAPPKKKTKTTAVAPRNNVASYNANWVSKKQYKSSVPAPSNTTPIKPAPKTFLSYTSDLERKSKVGALSGERLASMRPHQPDMLNFFTKLDKFKFNGATSSSSLSSSPSTPTRPSIPSVAPDSLSSPEKESPKKPALNSLLSPSKIVSDSEKEEEPQKMTNIKRKRNKALVTSDDELEIPKPAPSPKTSSPSVSSSISPSISSSNSPSSLSNKENIKTPSTLNSPLASMLTSKANGKKEMLAKTALSTLAKSPIIKANIPSKVVEIKDNNSVKDESDEDVVVTGSSKAKSVVIPEDDEEEEEEEEEEMEFGVESIIKSCENFSKKMWQILSGWEKNGQKEGTGMAKVPTILLCPLRSYQIIGLNWLALLYEQRMGGILADEMGLGKTVQTISLLAHLLERKNNAGPHLVIVPSTTLANWAREFAKWCPTMSVVTYYGNLKEREALRVSVMKLRSSTPGTYNVVLTTYNTAYGKLDRPFLKKINWEYMILDEAHSIKNSESTRYQNLLKLKTSYRLLLTGTPLQNDLSELWSLLNFLMPNVPKEADSIFQRLLGSNSSHTELLARMKKILSPFILRRLKSEVSQELKPKIDVTEKCSMAPVQKEKYNEVLQSSKKIWTQRHQDNNAAEKAKDAKKKKGRKKKSDDGDDLIEIEDMPQQTSVQGLLNNILMQMRKMANHPLLCRSFYTQEQIVTIRDILKQSDPDHMDDNPDYLLEDLEVASDFDLHQICRNNELLDGMKLSDEQLFESSGKMIRMKELLKELKANGSRVLLFSQMTKVLDILEVFLEHLGYKFVRLDGQTPVNTRQDIIDSYNKDRTIFIFLLSTKAGGMGINLTSAETVIFYDISFNPQVDKQAEDRCHRLGQEKQVKIIKLIAQDTVDQYMLQLSEQKKELHDSMLEEGAFEKEKGSKLEAKKLLKMFDNLFNNLPQE